MRFPFTFIGVLLVAIGVWVALYVAGHRTLDPLSLGLAIGTGIVCLGFGLYVLIRRVVRGPQH